MNCRCCHVSHSQWHSSPQFDSSPSVVVGGVIAVDGVVDVVVVDDDDAVVVVVAAAVVVIVVNIVGSPLTKLSFRFIRR